ncbi:MAG: GDSL-type esterase/lipase family protein [Firmicutes bacterium]|nr:GDSL-type esterase/lipase family protein [Bacillota bacterium]
MKRLFSLLLMTALVTTSLFTFGMSGNVYAATTWNYTVLGDSLGTGFGAWYGYVSRYRDHMEDDTGITVNLNNLSVNGWTSTDLLDALKNDPFYREAVASADVVTWDVGGNDMRKARNSYISETCGGANNEDCLREAVDTFQSNWDQIVSIIHDLRAEKPTNFKTMNVYNPYVNEDKAAPSYDGSTTRFAVFKPYLDEVNQFIDNQQSRGYEMADIYTAFNGPNHDQDPGDKGYIFLDGLHPNDTGHRVIAEHFRSLGYDPLQ